MEQTSLEGRLVVATPALADGVFDRAVVLILDHDDDGAMGVVLNEPSETPLAEAVPEWSDRAASPALVFVGGPVDRSVVVGLGRVEGADTDGWLPLGGPAAGSLGLVDLSRDPVLTGVREVRLFVGYAGWSPGQLEGELEAGAWFTVDAEPGDPFHPEPARLFADVLRRQGSDLALFATYPADPRAN